MRHAALLNSCVEVPGMDRLSWVFMSEHKVSIFKTCPFNIFRCSCFLSLVDAVYSGYQILNDSVFKISLNFQPPSPIPPHPTPMSSVFIMLNMWNGKILTKQKKTSLGNPTLRKCFLFLKILWTKNTETFGLVKYKHQNDQHGHILAFYDYQIKSLWWWDSWEY